MSRPFFDAYNARDSDAVDRLLDPDAQITTLTGSAGMPTRWSPGTTSEYFDTYNSRKAALEAAGLEE